MGTPLHPAIVHLPLGLAIIVPLVALGLTVALWRGWLPKRSWIAVVALQALMLGSAVLAMNTGEGDEERVERVVTETAIETHEEAAEIFTWGAGIVLAMTIAVLLVRKVELARLGSVIATAGTIAVALLAVRVGHAGGQLVYTHGAASAYATRASPGGAAVAAEGGAAGEARTGDDDDGARDGDRD